MKRSEANLILRRVEDQLEDVVLEMLRSVGAPAQAKQQWQSRWKEEANRAVMRVLTPLVTEMD